VHHLAGEVLQEYVPLDMAGWAYEAHDVWDVLIAAVEVYFWMKIKVAV
jgi:hypothetical protein